MNLFNMHIEMRQDLVWRLFLLFCAISIIIISSDTTFATDAGTSTDSTTDVVGETLCRLVKNLTGGTARGIATIAIFAVGVGLFVGKMQWPIAAVTAVGVGIIFSAPKLVGFLSGDAANNTCTGAPSTGTGS